MPAPNTSQAFVFGVTEVCSSPDEIFLTGQYDLSNFRPHMFDAFGIERPSTLERAVPKRLAEFLAGRVLARDALDRLGFEARQIGRGAHGEPLWPTGPNGVAGSLSHSHGVVGVWLSRTDAGLGLDIEHIPEMRALDAIRSGVLTDRERAMALDDTAVVAVFSAKEALFKGLFPHVGTRFGFSAAEVIAPPHSGEIRLSLTRDLAPGLRTQSRFVISQKWQKDCVISQFRLREIPAA